MRSIMDEKLLASLQKAGRSSAGEVEIEIVEAMRDRHGNVHGVREARDSFSAIVRRASEGDVQAVERGKEDLVLMVSVRDLARMAVTIARPLSFGEALDMMGFSPSGGRRLIARERASDDRPQIRERSAAVTRMTGLAG